MRIGQVLAEYLSWNGRIGRSRYLFVGLIGLAIKHNLDRFIASRFRMRWTILSYWVPVEQWRSPRSLSQDQRQFLFLLFVTALPFIWIGLMLTIKRLRDTQLPVWLSTFFFVPVLNLILFAVLCAYPGSLRSSAPTPAREMPNSFWPDHRIGSAVLAVAVGAFTGLIFTWLDLRLMGIYGFGLFLGLPFVMGYVAVWVVTRRRFANISDAVILATAVVGFAAMLIAVVAIEGLICLAMAFPIAWLMALFGALIARVIHNHYEGEHATSILAVVLMSVPLLMGAERLSPPPVPRFQVHTSIEISAPPEKVWSRLIQFPALAPPTEWPFRYAGVAFPIEARLSGEGLTADRECRFSTGNFKEPILVWEPGKHFAFSVSDEPLLMTETSPYGQIHVRHLDDHDFQPERADFVLTPLPNGGTRLEGTTTYINKMWPGAYWHLWTDAVVHSIHRRVFQHVKQLAEADVQAEPLGSVRRID